MSTHEFGDALAAKTLDCAREKGLMLPYRIPHRTFLSLTRGLDSESRGTQVEGRHPSLGSSPCFDSEGWQAPRPWLWIAGRKSGPNYSFWPLVPIDREGGPRCRHVRGFGVGFPHADIFVETIASTTCASND